MFLLVILWLQLKLFVPEHIYFLLFLNINQKSIFILDYIINNYYNKLVLLVFKINKIMRFVVKAVLNFWKKKIVKCPFRLSMTFILLHLKSIFVWSTAEWTKGHKNSMRNPWKTLFFFFLQTPRDNTHVLCPFDTFEFFLLFLLFCSYL